METHPYVKWMLICIKRKFDRSLHGFLHRGYLPCSGTDENQLLDLGVPTDKPFGENCHPTNEEQEEKWSANKSINDTIVHMSLYVSSV